MFLRNLEQLTLRRTVPWFTDDIAIAKWKSKSETDHQHFTEQRIAVNVVLKEAKDIHYPSVIDSNKVRFNCIDALLNKKCEPHYLSSTTDDNSGSIVHQ